VTGWYITKSEDEYACYDEYHEDEGDASARAKADLTDSGGGKSNNNKVYSSEEIAHNMAAANVANADLLSSMLHTPDMGSTERALAQRHGGIANKLCGPLNTCSISGDPGLGIDPKTSAGLVVMKVSRPALEPVREYIERLVLWMQATSQRVHDLVMHLSQIVCDFIRDDQGQWWFLQMKSFEISPQSISRCLAWHNYHEHGVPREKKMTSKEIRAKLDAERGYKCRMCSLNYQEGQTINVEVSERDQAALLAKASHHNKKNKQKEKRNLESMSGPQETRSVPAFGYELSRRMACHLAEFYRDEKFPLTKFSRSVLTGEAHVMESRSVVEKLRELEEVDLKKSSGGELSCCYFCFQIMEEQARQAARCADLHRVLGCTQGGFDDTNPRAVGANGVAVGTRRDPSPQPRARTAPGGTTSARNSSSIRPSSSKGGRGMLGTLTRTGVGAGPWESTAQQGESREEEEEEEGGEFGDDAGAIPPSAMLGEDYTAGTYKVHAVAPEISARNLARSIGCTMYRLVPRGYYECMAAGHRRRMRAQRQLRQSVQAFDFTSGAGVGGKGSTDSAKIDLFSMSMGANAESGDDDRQLPALLISDMDGGFGNEKWGSKHFKPETYQFRIFVMLHYLTELKIPQGAPVRGTYSFCSIVLPSFLVCDMSVALLSVYCCLLAFSDTAWRLTIIPISLSIVINRHNTYIAYYNTTGTVSCFSYALGQSVNHCPFVNEPQSGDHLDMVQIKQCRVHYLCGTIEDVRDWCRTKSIDLTLFQEPPDDAFLGEEAFTGTDTAARAPVEAGAVSISLESLRPGSFACTEGSEKIDSVCSVELETYGNQTASLRASIAIARDEVLPWQLAEVTSFLRDGDVFFPPQSYHDCTPLPIPWLYMLRTRPPPLRASTPEKLLLNSYDVEQKNGEEEEEEEEETTIPSMAAVLADDDGEEEAKHRGSTNGNAVATSTTAPSASPSKGAVAAAAESKAHTALRVELHAWFVTMVKLFKQCVKQEAENEKKVKAMQRAQNVIAGLQASGRDTGVDKRKRKQRNTAIANQKLMEAGYDMAEGEEEEEDEDEEEEEEKEEEEGEDEEEKSKSGSTEEDDSSESGSDESNYDYDDEVKTYGMIRLVFEHLRAAELEIIKNKKKRGAPQTPPRAHELVRLAIEQLLQQEHLPVEVSWVGFKYLMKECLVWSKTQGTLIVVAAQGDKDNAIKPPTGAIMPSIEMKLLNKEWVRQSNASISELSRLYPGRDLDVTFSALEMSGLDEARKPKKGTLAATLQEKQQHAAAARDSIEASLGLKRVTIVSPSSTLRKKRRFLIALAIFRLAGSSESAGDDTLDVAELKFYLEAQREKLRKFISLFLEGVVHFPIMLKSYLVSIQEEVSMERTVMCCNLLSHSGSLTQLFETYESQGTALISKAGFIKAVEESHYNVSNRAPPAVAYGLQVDRVIDELRALASEKNAYIRKKETTGTARKASFNLGLAQDGQTSDLSRLAETRRSSIVATAGPVRILLYYCSSPFPCL
jgi:hypothetical protein